MLADHPVLHHAIAFGLWYLVFGATTWTWLYCSSIWIDVHQRRVSAGLSYSSVAIFFAGTWLILAWPLVAWAFLRALLVSVRRAR